MHVTMIGTGYVGLVSGAGIADFGLNVTCVDRDEEKIQSLQRGKIPIYEIGLEEIVRRNVKNQRLSFTTNLEQSISRSLVIFIAVGTPEGPDGKPDLSQLESVVASIAKSMHEYKVIVTKSTVPVGTGRWIRQLIERNQTRQVKFDIVSNPEFLREGSAIEDFMRPNRVVIGAESEQAAAIIRDIYRPLYLIETPFVTTNLETAELIKYASNAFLATKISFINEIANLCEQIGADIHHVSRAMGLDNRIGSKFLHPGPGYGGSCFPKDTKALAQMGKDFNSRLRIVEAVIEVNRHQKARVVSKITEALSGVSSKRIALLGLSFKPNTDDIRESPAVAIGLSLIEEGAFIQVYDPVAIPNAKQVLTGDRVAYCKDAYEAALGVDAVLIATEWNEFRNLDMDKLKNAMKRPLVFDCRNIFDPEKMSKLGFEYHGTGR
ncbi:MAG: UDP-glucose/GDP-mannose dehydrogenase family protein [Terriglobia bacterium]